MIDYAKDFNPTMGDDADYARIRLLSRDERMALTRGVLMRDWLILCQDPDIDVALAAVCDPMEGQSLNGKHSNALISLLSASFTDVAPYAAYNERLRLAAAEHQRLDSHVSRTARRMSDDRMHAALAKNRHGGHDMGQFFCDHPSVEVRTNYASNHSAVSLNSLRTLANDLDIEVRRAAFNTLVESHYYLNDWDSTPAEILAGLAPEFSDDPNITPGSRSTTVTGIGAT